MKAIVVHRGARDNYQLALALAERGLLERLVTDLYWTGEAAAGSRWQASLSARHCPGIPASMVKRCLFSGGFSFALEKSPHAPFRWRSHAARWADRVVGSVAGRLATETGAALISYSYYGHSAFLAASARTPRILFQLHPHPLSVRRILLQELAEQPECADSLNKEWELALPENDFDRLVQEAAMAVTVIVASSFSRTTLIENGIDAARVHVVPYGVDLDKFHPAPERKASSAPRPLRLLFVGQINQRKGIKYLLEALKLLPGLPIELTVCGRVVDRLQLFQDLGDRVKVRGAVSSADLLQAYQSSDLFVFPSLAEGFGHVLLEAMACALPVLSTTSTAAADLVTEGKDGFVVEPRRPDLLAAKIGWAWENRDELLRMGLRARRKAEQFTWMRFRERIADVVEQSLTGGAPARAAREVAHV